MKDVKIIIILLLLFCIMCASDYISILSDFRHIYRQLIFIIIPGFVSAYILGYMKGNIFVTLFAPTTYTVLFFYISEQIEGNFSRKGDVIEANIARFILFLFICCILAFIGWIHKSIIDKNIHD